jgi:organic hydroperoxide reductase OsmC/OhrA
MKPYPHHYTVVATGAPSGNVTLEAPGVAALTSAPPVEFDGPGDQWSPESLLVAAVVDCFVLTFRAIARASKLPWGRLVCRAEGTLDRTDSVTRFVAMRIEADLEIPAGGNTELGRRLLEKAERGCLVTSSLRCEATLEPRVQETA